MKYPDLVPEKVCVTPCTIYRTDGINRDGSKKHVETFNGNCMYVEKAHQTLSAEKQLITLSATAFFHGDISPENPKIDGYAEIDGKERKIYSSEKAKNLDGTVNFTKLELI